MTTNDEDKPEHPHLTYQNRLKLCPVVTTTADKLRQAKEQIVQAAMEATSELDLQILHAKMDDILKFDDN
jgi:hypothetical protein